MEKLISISSPIPDPKHDSTQQIIDSVAPNRPGIIFFWDRAGVFWFVEGTDNIKAHLTLIRTVAGHPRRQGVKFAFEEWSDETERTKRLQRTKRLHFVIDHNNPSGQERIQHSA